MKSFMFFVLAVISLPLIISAQTESSYDISKPYKVYDAFNKHYFYNDGEVMAVKVTRKLTTIQKFNSENMNLLSVNEYKDALGGRSYEGILEVGENYYLMLSSYDKKAKRRSLYYKIIDFGTGTIASQEYELVKSVNSMHGFSFLRSSDESRVMVLYNTPPLVRNDAKNNAIHGMYVFDSGLERISGQEIKMPYTEKQQINKDYIVDNKGNIYILAKVFKDVSRDNEKRGEDNPNYRMEVLKLGVDQEDFDIIPIDLEDKFITSIWLYESNKGYLFCTGYYSDNRDRYDANGVFLFKISNDGEVMDKAHYEIPMEIINQNASGRTLKKNKKDEKKDKADLEDLEMRNLRVQKDGSIVLVGEQHYVRVYTTTDSKGNTRTRYVYYYNDILVTKISPAGELEWMKKLPKRQKGGNGIGGMSFKYFNSGEKHYFVFMDHEENKNIIDKGVPVYHTSGAGGFLTSYVINDSDGSVSKNSIFDSRNANGIKLYQFNIGRILPVAANQFVIEFYKKKKEDVMVKVTLD